jgi:hypothetical protein
MPLAFTAWCAGPVSAAVDSCSGRALVCGDWQAVPWRVLGQQRGAWRKIDFVKPMRAGRDFGAARGDARLILKLAQHGRLDSENKK